ncbi:DUF4339 domain-containing protein [Fimbriimonas ginsengisoli]|uniref:TM2 domain-containing protein n=1 Tax=Fimbriimonas ginsengisoli Gsoil 348 TaxID=661478 RepID=A0A068NIR6_FIMGI|nr:DUF4339 domain-containing protein [Fimbriimonas ginsengisoli]AIE83488.1 TM2 domain-containing protein [Fimbriimonas ginsengisoli Gsoil 348]
MTAEWYYIGHYGQLGPLTREQIDELVEGGVIARDTYVWRAGMSEWLAADQISELATSFRRADPYTTPPPSPTPRVVAPPAPPLARTSPRPFDQTLANQAPNYLSFPLTRSDKSRTLGGILQLIVPGVGRMYLGFSAIGVLQLVLSLCGVGILWSWVDGIIILAGGVRMDGYGRQLND